MILQAASNRGACHTIQIQFQSQIVTFGVLGLEEQKKRVFSRSTFESLVLNLAAPASSFKQNVRATVFFI